MPPRPLQYLIIDDSEIDRIITSRLLKVRMGATEMHLAENGIKGIECVNEKFRRPKSAIVILLDIQMPEMDGFEFLDEYEKMDTAVKRRTQIFMLSSTIDPTDIERARKHNFVTALLAKPLHIEELIRFIGR